MGRMRPSCSWYSTRLGDDAIGEPTNPQAAGDVGNCLAFICGLPVAVCTRSDLRLH
jgi:hypothetical protein